MGKREKGLLASDTRASLTSAPAGQDLAAAVQSMRSKTSEVSKLGADEVLNNLDSMLAESKAISISTVEEAVEKSVLAQQAEAESKEKYVRGLALVMRQRDILAAAVSAFEKATEKNRLLAAVQEPEEVREARDKIAELSRNIAVVQKQRPGIFTLAEVESINLYIDELARTSELSVEKIQEVFSTTVRMGLVGEPHRREKDEALENVFVLGGQIYPLWSKRDESRYHSSLFSNLTKLAKKYGKFRAEARTLHVHDMQRGADVSIIDVAQAGEPGTFFIRFVNRDKQPGYLLAKSDGRKISVEETEGAANFLKRGTFIPLRALQTGFLARELEEKVGEREYKKLTSLVYILRDACKSEREMEEKVSAPAETENGGVEA